MRTNITTLPVGFLALVLCSMLLSGCSTANPQRYSSADTPARLFTRETNGIRVSVDAILDKERNHKYFSTDAVGKGIVPVFVRVENISSPGSVLIEKEQFKIALNADAEGAAPLSGEVKNDPNAAGVAAGAVGLLALSGPLIIVGAMSISTADEIRHNFVDKEFRNQSLAQGRVVEGFVYAQRASQKGPIRAVKISVPFQNLKTDRADVCEFLLQNEDLKK
jgi:hypothetical protein